MMLHCPLTSCFPFCSQTFSDAEDNLPNTLVCDDDVCWDSDTSGVQVCKSFTKELKFEKIHGNNLWNESTRPSLSHHSKFRTFILPAVGQEIGWYQQMLSYQICFDGVFGGHRKLRLVNPGHKKGTPAEDLWLRRKHGF
jgi:hypothetical protein